MNQSKNWVILSIVLFFFVGLLAGILAGMFIERGSSKCALPPAPPFQGKPDMMKPPQEPEQFREMFVKHLSEELSLTQDQENKIREIMTENDKNILSMRDEIRKNMLETHNKISEQIKSVLNEEQKKKFEEIDRNMMERMEEGFGPPPPGMRRGGEFFPGPGGDRPDRRFGGPGADGNRQPGPGPRPGRPEPGQGPGQGQ